MPMIFAALTAFSLGAARAAEFGYTSAAQLRQTPFAAPAVAARPASPEQPGQVERPHLWAWAGKDYLYGFADRRAQYREAVELWTKILSGAGIRVVRTSFDHGTYRIDYQTPDGRVIRHFRSHPAQFAPRDEAALAANLAQVRATAQAAGLDVLAGVVGRFAPKPPVYRLYYLAKPEANGLRESLIRVLDPGREIAFDIIARSGVRFVQEAKSWLLVYIGPAIEPLSFSAPTMAEAQAVRDAYIEGETAQGKRLIGSRIRRVPQDADTPYWIDLYFFE